MCALEESLNGLDFTKLDHYVGVSAGAFIVASLANGISPRALCASFIENDSEPSETFDPSWLLKPAYGRDVANLGEREAFEFITAFDAIHDQAKPRSVLKGIHDALRPGGVFLMMDEGASSRLEENIDSPLTPLLYTFSTFHCMTVSLAYGGEGLGTCWGRQKALELLAEAGFRDVDVQTIEGDIEHYYYIARKRA